MKRGIILEDKLIGETFSKLKSPVKSYKILLAVQGEDGRLSLVNIIPMFFIIRILLLKAVDFSMRWGSKYLNKMG